MYLYLCSFAQTMANGKQYHDSVLVLQCFSMQPDKSKNCSNAICLAGCWHIVCHGEHFIICFFFCVGVHIEKFFKSWDTFTHNANAFRQAVFHFIWILCHINSHVSTHCIQVFCIEIERLNLLKGMQKLAYMIEI